MSYSDVPPWCANSGTAVRSTTKGEHFAFHWQPPVDSLNDSETNASTNSKRFYCAWALGRERAAKRDVGASLYAHHASDGPSSFNVFLQAATQRVVAQVSRHVLFSPRKSWCVPAYTIFKTIGQAVARDLS